jgi:hypothetical protein
MASDVCALVGDGLDNSDSSYRKDLVTLGNLPMVSFYDSNYKPNLQPNNMSLTPPTIGSVTLDPCVWVYALLGRLARNEHISKSTFFGGSQDVPDDWKVAEALRLFMSCRWWRRMWIVQEVVVPKDIKLIYGRATARWEIFHRAATSWTQHSTVCCINATQQISPECSKLLNRICRTIVSIGQVRKQYQHRRLSPLPSQINVDIEPLVSLLHLFRDREASDPRDKVYALLALLPDQAARAIIQPDYTISASEVFQKTALTIIQQSQSLSIIAADLGVQLKYRQGLPSWTPDWSAPGNSSDTFSGLYKAARETKADCAEVVEIDQRQLLRVKGLCVTTIEDCKFQPLSSPCDQLWKLLCADVITGSPGKEVRATHSHAFWFLLWAWLQYPGQMGDRIGKPYVRSSAQWRRLQLLRHLQSRKAITHKHAKSHYPGPSILRPSIPRMRASLMHLPHPISHTFVFAVLGKQKNEVTTTATFLRSRIHSSSMARQWLNHYHKDPSNKDINELIEICFDEVLSLIGSSVRRATANPSRRFFKTKDGHQGAGPSAFQVGDEVAILEGAETPMILRRSSITMDSNVVYEVVGASYVQGIMDGEAMEKLQREGKNTKTIYLC